MSIIDAPSERGVEAIAKHEGFVSRAYLCPASVLTIGYGFTMRSRIFASYWRAKHGRDLRMGDTISREEADTVLRQLIVDEYGDAVVRDIRPRRPHHYDGAASMCFNCGPGAARWRWGKALRDGDPPESARLLRVTAVTANGRRLPGLVRRRDEEANIVEHAQYTSGPAPSRDREEVRWYQDRLNTLGYDAGPVDGLRGPRTKAAVWAFQGDHDLTVDGIVGPATRAVIIRELDKRNEKAATGGGAAAGGATGGGEAVLTGQEAIALDTLAQAGVGALVVGGLAFAGYWLFRNRGRFTGVRVPT